MRKKKGILIPYKGKIRKKKNKENKGTLITLKEEVDIKCTT